MREYRCRALRALVPALLGAGALSCSPAQIPPAPSTVTPPQAPAVPAAVPPNPGPTFLSDTDAAYGLLEKLQRVAYENEPNSFRWVGSEDQIEKTRTLMRELDRRDDPLNVTVPGYESGLDRQQAALAKMTLPTRFEDPISLSILSGITRDLETSVKFAGLKPPRTGTLPLATLNAQTIRVPGADTPLVVVHSSLFSFCHEMTKIALKTVTFEMTPEGEMSINYTPERFDAGPRRDRNLVVRLSMAVEDFSLDRRVVGHARPDPVHDRILQPLVHAAELFALAHEYGHIVLGHEAGPGAALQLREGLSGAAAEAVVRTWGQEASADIFAAVVIEHLVADGRLARGGDDEFEKWLGEVYRQAPILFLEYVRIAEEAKYIRRHHAMPPEPNQEEQDSTLRVLREALGAGLATKVANEARPNPNETPGVLASTHPPDWARQLLMLATWAELTPASRTPEQERFSDLGRALTLNMRTMWNDLKPMWVEISRRTPR